MRIAMVRYKVKPDRAAENERLVKEVFAQLEREKPAGLRYNTFKLRDGVSFVHLALVDTPDGSNPLFAVDAFKRFSESVKDRCEEMPVTTELDPIGHYRPPSDVGT